MTIGIPFPDLAVLTMDEQLGFLIAGDVPSHFDRLPLRRVDRRDPLISFASDSPAVLMRNNMLILFRYFYASWSHCR